MDTEEDPPEVDMEEDPPGSGHGRGTPPRSGHRRDPPQEVDMAEDPLEVDVEEDPPEVDAEEVVEEDQLRSTAGQAGGMPQKKGFLVVGCYSVTSFQRSSVQLFIKFSFTRFLYCPIYYARMEYIQLFGLHYKLRSLVLSLCMSDLLLFVLG